jgi:two-component system, NtrC family, nitrogen regulation response regulator NtrX
MAKVLVVDDEKGIREALESILVRQGYEVTLVQDLSSASRHLESEDFDAALIDLRLPDGDGRELIPKARKKFTGVIMISGHATVSLAVEAVKQGAFDFLEKPLDRDRLLIILGNAVREKELRQKGEPDLIYKSPNMEKIVADAEKFARSKEPVLIIGETGSGKEVLARMIHRMSQHSKGPFVAVNCAAIPENLAESELFGHAKGAFTGASETRKGKFQTADGGTLFLDEIGELSPATQARLLRAIEEEKVEPVGADKSIKVNTRILAATNSDLARWTREGKFRQDLFYRISGLKIEIPPLRDRKEDIGLLARKFLKESFEREGWDYREPHADFFETLRNHEWKGNVRELRRVMSRVVLLSGGGPVESASLPSEFFAKEVHPSLKGIKEEAEAEKIKEALVQFSGNVQATAKNLKISRSRLYEKLVRYKINPGDFRS